MSGSGRSVVCDRLGCSASSLETSRCLKEDSVGGDFLSVLTAITRVEHT